MVSEAHLEVGKQAWVGSGRSTVPEPRLHPQTFLFPFVMKTPKCLLCAQPEVLSGRDERDPEKGGQPLPRSPRPVSHLPSLLLCDFEEITFPLQDFVTLRLPVTVLLPPTRDVIMMGTGLINCKALYLWKPTGTLVTSEKGKIKVSLVAT